MEYIFGRKPVLEALQKNVNVERIYLKYGIENNFLFKIKRLAFQKKIPVSLISKKKFEELEKGRNSQGIIARITSIKLYKIEEIIKDLDLSKNPVILILERIQDPRNLGAILRTAACAAVDAVAITTKESCDITDTAIKTSAGGVFQLKISKIDNINQTIEFLKNHNFFIVGSSLETAEAYDKINYNNPVVLILGNEEKGLKKSTLKLCDKIAKIPIFGKMQSLNVSVAAGIFLFEIKRQQSLNS